MEKRGNTREVILGAIVDIHGDDENNGVCNHKNRDQPRAPFLVMLYLVVKHWAWGCRRYGGSVYVNWVNRVLP